MRLICLWVGDATFGFQMQLIGRPDLYGSPFSQSSVIVVVVLASEVVDNGVALDIDRGGTILHHHRWAVKVDAVVDHEQRVIVVDDVVVDAYAVKVLLEQILEEEIFLLECSLLLLDGQLVQVSLVEALVEVVELLEFIVRLGGNALDSVDFLVRLFLGIGVTRVEGQDFFLFSFELAAEFGCLENALTKRLIATQSFHAGETIGDERAEGILLLSALRCHLLLKRVIVLDDLNPLKVERIITIVILTLNLSGLECQLRRLLFDAVDVTNSFSDGIGRRRVLGKHLGVVLRFLLRLMHVLLEFDLESVVKSVDLLDEVHLHSLGLLDVLVTRLLLLSEEVVLDLAELGLLLLDDRLDHLT